eukprot:g6369.t1
MGAFAFVALSLYTSGAAAESFEPTGMQLAAFAGGRFGRATAGGAVSRWIGRSVGAGGGDCPRGGRVRVRVAAFADTAHGSDGSSGTLNAVGEGGGITAGSAVVSRERRGIRRSPFRSRSSSPNLAVAGVGVAGGSARPVSTSPRSRSTCCFSSTGAAAAAADDGSSATAVDGSRSGGDDEEEKGEAEWPAPHPGQAYVARARCGQRYEHPEGGTRIRAVVSDLDGTLLGPDKRVSATTLEAVRKARAKGVVFVPASGRSKAGMFSSMGELGEDLKRDGAPFVCMNGLTVYGQGDGDGDHGDIIHSELMCPKLARKVVSFWREHPLAAAAGVSLCGSEGETIVVERLDARTRSFTDWKEPLPKEVGNWEDAIAGGMELNRLYFWGPSRAAVDAFQDDLKEHLKDNPAELTRGVPEMIEVLPEGASKAVGLEALLRELGIAPQEVIALGDEENDVEMLRSVVGVAMGQSSLKVRRSAQFTAPSNALHGVAVALETFCGVVPKNIYGAMAPSKPTGDRLLQRHRHNTITAASPAAATATATATAKETPVPALLSPRRLPDRVPHGNGSGVTGDVYHTRTADHARDFGSGIIAITGDRYCNGNGKWPVFVLFAVVLGRRRQRVLRKLQSQRFHLRGARPLNRVPYGDSSGVAGDIYYILYYTGAPVSPGDKRSKGVVGSAWLRGGREGNGTSGWDMGQRAGKKGHGAGVRA